MQWAQVSPSAFPHPPHPHNLLSSFSWLYQLYHIAVLLMRLCIAGVHDDMEAGESADIANTCANAQTPR